ncbi:NADP-dependent oxidoreductase domain-containing protein [Xylogone sp. PMI_703]|nr:NADP-dependent oxidoreductase domain-containing protein [Xylogone sp. PMI_703]
MTPPTRALGKYGPQVTAIGIGLMGLSAFYGATESDDERFKFLDYIYEAGERFWDTSDAYGDSEQLLGKWFERNPEKRSQIVLATKFGNLGSGLARNDRDFVHQSCENSLQRLKTNYIDLYYVHRVDFQTPIEETIKAMVELKEQGKIRYLGLSEVSAATIRRADSVHHIAAVQVEYSPFALEIESSEINLLRTCRELGIAVVAYSPLGRGMLTGRYKSRDDLEEDDFRRGIPRFSAENFDSNLQLVRDIQAIAARKGCTAGQLTLAWLLAQGLDIIPIPGTRKTKYFDENMGALQVNLSPEENEEIRGLVAKFEVIGDRYPPGWERSLFADTIALSK